MKKLMIVSLIAAAGLTVAACKKEAAPVDTNTVAVPEADALNGTANDTMGDVNAVAGANTVAAATNAVAPAANAVAPAAEAANATK
ncbi:MAG: hypothetical protein RIS52_1892 [Pseudomonadota bacterium]|jgi:hypothetical protein